MSTLPYIAIVGRTNVGKSTLFNRIIKKKKAIVLDTPGVTRDRNYEEASFEGKKFVLIDTGGFEADEGDVTLKQMKKQTQLAIEEADTVIFLADGKSGLMPQDFEIIKLLRKSEKDFFAAVNKLESDVRFEEAYQFYELGIEKIYKISALHGIGISELLSDILSPLAGDFSVGEESQGNVPKIAVVGRPNVGKSSFINAVIGEERFVATDFPGTTRDSIDTFYEKGDEKYIFIDTAGIRRKSRISYTLEKYCVIQAFKAIDRADIAILILEASEGITDQDERIAGYAFEKNKPVIILVNKWDTVNTSFNSYKKNMEMKLTFLSFAPVLNISATKRLNIRKVFPLIKRLYFQYTKRIPTSELNRTLEDLSSRHSHPIVKGKRIKLLYITQPETSPPTFIVFTNSSESLHFSFYRYLKNYLRKAFKMEEIPIQIFLKRREKGRK